MSKPRRFLSSCYAAALASALFASGLSASPALAESLDSTTAAHVEQTAADTTDETVTSVEVPAEDTTVESCDVVTDGAGDVAQECGTTTTVEFEEGQTEAPSTSADGAETVDAEEGTVADAEAEAADEAAATQATDAEGSEADAGDSDEVATLDTETSVQDESVATTQADEEVAETVLEESSSMLYGVDISGHNTGINYSKLGDFVIIKATEWNPYKNSYTTYNDYVTQAESALKAGKLIGFYHFATNPTSRGNGQTMKQQAQGFIDAVKSYVGKAVLCLDWEDTDYSDVESHVSWAKEWLDYVYDKTGVKCVVYTNKSCTNNYNWSSVANAGYKLWGAMWLNRYTDNKEANSSGFVTNPDYTAYGNWGAWGAQPAIYQYGAAVLHGSKDYDVDVFYGTRDDWEDLAGVFEVSTSAKAAAKLLTNNSVYSFSTRSSGELGLASISGNAQLGKTDYLTAYWRVENLGDGTYRFYSLTDGKLLTFASSAKAGSNVSTTSSTGSNTLWTLIKCTNGAIALVPNGYTKLRLDVSAGKLDDNGRNLQLYTSNGSIAQRFHYTLMSALTEAYKAGKTVSEGYYLIQSVADTTKALDVKGASSANGANVQIYASNGSFAQRYELTYVGYGLYTLKSAGSGKMIDVAAGSKANGANVQQYQANNTLAQMWHLRKTGSSYTIVSALSGRVLDLAAGKTANGTNVRIYNSNGTAAQKFNLVADKILDAADAIGENVSEGIYSLFSALNASAAVDVQSGSKANGANVRVYASNGSLAQMYDVSYCGHGFYTIRMAHSGKVLDVRGGSSASGANVQQYAGNGSRAQMWYFVKDGSGYQIRSAVSGNALTVDGSSAANGTNISVRTASGTTAQRFTLKETAALSDDTYVVKSSLGNLRLDVKDISTANGANVQLWTSNNSKAQRWVFTYLGNGAYKITNVASGKALDVRGGSTANGANIQQWAYNGSAAQRWRIRISSTGAMMLQNVGSGLVVDVAGGKKAAGTNIQQYAINGSTAQTFVITKA